MRYILCFLLPDDLSQEINLVREYFEKGVSKRIPPHISLTYPFWHEGKIEKTIDKMQTFVSNFSSFSSLIGDIKTFDKENGAGVIYLSLDPEEGLRNLHEKIENNLGTVTFDTRFFPNQKLPEKYKPHITVVMNGKASDLEWVQKKLEKIRGKEFLVDQITLLRNEKPKEKWKILKVFKLKT